MYLCMYVCIYLSIYTYISLYLSLSIHVYIYIYIHISIYISIYLYTHGLPLGAWRGFLVHGNYFVPSTLAHAKKLGRTRKPTAATRTQLQVVWFSMFNSNSDFDIPLSSNNNGFHIHFKQQHCSNTTVSILIFHKTHFKMSYPLFWSPLSIMCEHIHIYSHICIHDYACTYTHTLYIHVCNDIRIHLSLSIYIYIYVYMCVCVYIYIYSKQGYTTHLHIYVCIYIYIYICRAQLKPRDYI